MLQQQDNTLRSADDRPLKVFSRNDLVVSDSSFQSEPCKIIKDPISLKYFRLLLPEYEVLTMLNGDHSISQIRDRLQEMFPEKEIRTSDINSLISSFHRSSLTYSLAEGQATPILKRAQKESNQKKLQLLSSVLSLKFPGVDPERFLAWGYPKIKWMFHPWVVFFCFCLMAAAGLLVLRNFGEFYRRLPEFQQFFSMNNLLMMGGMLIITKVIHELGHGFFCKHFGGECHEIGFMLLVLMPAMYCNTSDSWVLPNKWKRAAIGAAGMYVEVVMASICTFIWWYTKPGFINYVCLNVMFLSSVSTIVFNANPLLRYDGYYILSDILEIPNLAQKSKMSMLSKLRHWCLGMDPVNSRFLPQRNQIMFALYSVASFVYRWFVLIVILFFLTKVFKPYGLEVLGHTMILISLVGMVGIPAYKLTKFFIYPGRFRQVKKPNFITSAIIFGLLAAFVLFVPLPYKVPADLIVKPRNGFEVYVQETGTLKQIKIQPGDTVIRENQLLAVLENKPLDLEIEQLQGQLEELEVTRDGYKRSNSVDAAEQLASINASIVDYQNQLAMLEKNRKNLEIRAPITGQIIPPDAKPSSATSASLGGWAGTPFDVENKNAVLQRGELFCIIGDKDRMQASLVIDQTDHSMVGLGDRVSIMLDEYPGKVFKSTITAMSDSDVSVVDPRLTQVAGGAIMTKPTAEGELAYVSYQAHAPLVLTSRPLLSGFRGKAKIHVGYISLFERGMRMFKKVVNFR